MSGFVILTFTINYKERGTNMMKLKMMKYIISPKLTTYKGNLPQNTQYSLLKREPARFVVDLCKTATTPSPFKEGKITNFLEKMLKKIYS